MKKTLKSLLLTISAMLFVISASAQVTTSSLSGRTLDKDGASVPGAAVIATHTLSGTTYYAVTNEEGRFTINGMRSGGPYSVEVSSMGYRSVKYTDITLALAEVYALTATLADDNEMLEGAVVVSTANSRFATEKTGAATNISSREITSLPTVTRNITDVTRLSAYGGNGMTFAGADGRTANFTVDGANFNNNFGLSSNLPGGGSPISIDAIEEMQVVISPYDVRQTNFVGGGVNAITKSGTNTFKGTAYFYHRNENMRGDVVAGQAVSGARDMDRNTTYGFTLGGPIVKNKLFFFVNFENTTVPTVVNRWQASTDGKMDADAKISRTTVADMEKVQKYVMDKYGYDTGSFTDFSATNSNMKVLARIDWNINDANKLSLRYNYTKNTTWTNANGSSMDGGVRMSSDRTSKYSNIFRNTLYSNNNLVQTWSLNLNSRISDYIHNEFLATYSMLDDVRGSNSSPFPHIDILEKDEEGNIQPYMSLGYELFTWNNGVHNRVVTVKDDLTMYMGSHKILVGASYEYQMADNIYMRNGTGYYRYNSLNDFLTEQAPEVVCLTYGYDGETAPAARVRYNKFSIYAQEEMSVNDNLVLTAGLRGDFLVFNNKDLMTNQAIYNLDYSGNGYHLGEGNSPLTIDTLTAEQANASLRANTGKWPTSKFIVSPRIGFNWDVLGNKSLKIRGGTGFFSGRIPLVFFTNMPTNGGLVQYKGVYNGNGKNGGQEVDMSKFAGSIVTDINALKKRIVDNGYGVTTVKPEDGVVGSNFSGVDPKYKLPQVWKTSLAVDYQLPTEFPFSITVEGIFNKNINATCISDWSIKPIAGFAKFNGPDNRPIYPSDNKYTHLVKDLDNNGVQRTDEAGNPKWKSSGLPNAYMLSNTNQGYGYIASITLNARPIKNLNLMAAYTHTASYELTGMPGSDASSAFTYVPGYNGPNNAVLHASQYVTPNRVVASANYSDKSNNHYSFIYEAWQGGSNYSYILVNDMNGDGYNYDTIYIPANDDDLRFVSPNDKTRFMDFVNADPYLSKNKGKYTEAYSVYSPWVHRLDFHYNHDFKIKIGSTTNTLQLNIDVKNILNLINSNWGVSKIMNPDLNSGRILKYEGVDAEGYPTFSTPKNVKAGIDTWTPSINIGQCWSAQIGFKYLFN